MKAIHNAAKFHKILRFTKGFILCNFTLLLCFMKRISTMWLLLAPGYVAEMIAHYIEKSTARI